MLNLLDDLRTRFHLALLYITHDIASARYFADEVLVMYAGRIVERGPAEDVTQPPAHPYTQLLIASAPDPDNLGSALRRAARTRHGSVARHTAADGRPVAVAARSAPGARSPTTGAGARPRAAAADLRARAAACWRLDVAAPELTARNATRGGRSRDRVAGNSPPDTTHEEGQSDDEEI